MQPGQLTKGDRTMFGIDDMLMKLARQVLQGILSQLMNQLNVVEQQALQPLRQMIQEVTNGIWIGEGANAFVEEIQNMMIPDTTKITTQIRTVHTNLQFAQQVIEQADTKVSRMVTSRLTDAFRFI